MVTGGREARRLRLHAASVWASTRDRWDDARRAPVNAIHPHDRARFLAAVLIAAPITAAAPARGTRQRRWSRAAPSGPSCRGQGDGQERAPWGNAPPTGVPAQAYPFDETPGARIRGTDEQWLRAAPRAGRPVVASASALDRSGSLRSAAIDPSSPRSGAPPPRALMDLLQRRAGPAGMVQRSALTRGIPS